MKVLAIESSGMTASIAIATEDTLIGEYTINYKKTHSQTLLPMIDEIVKFTDTNLAELDAIAVSSGPGSFTGLRIGSATAKGLALALDKPIVTVPTMDAMAYNFYAYEGIICPMVDARRNRVYTGIYQFKDEQLEIFEKQDVLEIEKIIEKINQIEKKVIFLGDGCKVYKTYIEENVKVPYLIAPFYKKEPSAASVAALAMEMIKNGEVDDADAHTPIYLRPSQAESEKMKNDNKANE